MSAQALLLPGLLFENCHCATSVAQTPSLTCSSLLLSQNPQCSTLAGLAAASAGSSAPPRPLQLQWPFAWLSLWAWPCPWPCGLVAGGRVLHLTKKGPTLAGLGAASAGSSSASSSSSAAAAAFRLAVALGLALPFAFGAALSALALDAAFSALALGALTGSGSASSYTRGLRFSTACLAACICQSRLVVCTCILAQASVLVSAIARAPQRRSRSLKAPQADNSESTPPLAPHHRHFHRPHRPLARRRRLSWPCSCAGWLPSSSACLPWPPSSWPPASHLMSGLPCVA